MSLKLYNIISPTLAQWKERKKKGRKERKNLRKDNTHTHIHTHIHTHSGETERVTVCVFERRDKGRDAKKAKITR